MPVAHRKTGGSHQVGPYFERISAIKQARGEQVEQISLQDRTIAVRTGTIISSIDNAFNNLESAIGPVFDQGRELQVLNRHIRTELRDVDRALALEDAAVINFSEHPDTLITPDFYRHMLAPKPIYDYWVGYRGWNHSCGVDAKAHNGPTTGIAFAHAVDALNVLLGLSSAFIALYANSPFAAGEITPYRENRLTIWETMFATARFPCDRKLCRMPEAPFTGLKDYFRWMFGPGTRMQFLVPDRCADYKKSCDLTVIENDPPVLDFLRQPTARARNFYSREEITVVPRMQHFEFLQFSQFLDARIRYALKDGEFPVQDFLAAMADDSLSLAELFSQQTKYCYMEGRAAGANFPDRELAGLDDADVPGSVVVSPSAIQKGLLGNPGEAKQLVGRYRWADLAGLRHQAIRSGLQGEYNGIRVDVLCRQVIAVAARGLDASEQWMLAYPQYVLSRMQNGADRALARYERLSGTRARRMKQLILDRQIVA